MQQNGLEVTDEMEDAMQEHEEKGHTAVLVGIDGKYRSDVYLSYLQCKLGNTVSCCLR